MSDECTCHRTATGCLIHPQGIDTYFASLSREDMRQILVAHGFQVDPSWTRQELQEIIMEHDIGGPPVTSTPIDTDTPPELFRLLESLIGFQQGELTRQLSRSAMKLRIQGQLEALEWVMQQIVDIRDSASTEITNEPCPTCHGDGWVIEGQSMGFPSGEQVECPDCGGVSVEMMQQQPGESRADWKNRTFALHFGRGRLSQRDPSEQSLPQHDHPVLKADHRGRVFVKQNGKWVPITQNGASVPAGPPSAATYRQWMEDILRDETNFGPRSASLDWMGARNQFTLFHESAADTLHDILRSYQPWQQKIVKKITDITES